MSVAVFFGSGKISEKEESYNNTMILSETAAALGYDIASGGYGGIMEAACRGAVNSNVRRIGVTCNSLTNRKPNDFLSDEIKTKDYFERLEILIDIGDLFVAMKGESGTLLEVSAVTALMERELICNRKLILVGEDWKNLAGFIHFSHFKNCIQIAEDVTKAVEFIKSFKN